MARIGFHIGPFYFSQRLGRTQAQKRAAAKAAASRRQRRRNAKAHSEREREYNFPAAVAAREAAVAEREAARADHDARTYRAVISACKIDPLKGGAFTIGIEAEDTNFVFNVDASAALHFLPLNNGDVVQVTLSPGRTGLEEFYQLSRASGAKPRSAIGLSRADMERYGLTTKPAQPRPDADP